MNPKRSTKSFVSQLGAYAEIQELYDHALIDKEGVIALTEAIAGQTELPAFAPQKLVCKLFKKGYHSLEFYRELETEVLKTPPRSIFH